MAADFLSAWLGRARQRREHGQVAWAAEIVETQKDFPFIVVSPQCPPDTGWKPMELNLLLDSILANYRADPDRVYLTGLSMGGFGTWDWACQNADRFAAIAPMCGGGNTSLVRRIRNLPIWVFHGEADPVVPIAKSEEMVADCKKRVRMCGSPTTPASATTAGRSHMATRSCTSGSSRIIGGKFERRRPSRQLRLRGNDTSTRRLQKNLFLAGSPRTF